MKKLWLLATTIAFVLALNTFAAPVQVGVVETVEENLDQGYSESFPIDGVILSEDIKFDFSSGEVPSAFNGNGMTLSVVESPVEGDSGNKVLKATNGSSGQPSFYIYFDELLDPTKTYVVSYKAWKKKPEGIIESGTMNFRTRSLDYSSASVANPNGYAKTDYDWMGFIATNPFKANTLDWIDYTFEYTPREGATVPYGRAQIQVELKSAQEIVYFDDFSIKEKRDEIEEVPAVNIGYDFTSGEVPSAFNGNGMTLSVVESPVEGDSGNNVLKATNGSAGQPSFYIYFDEILDPTKTYIVSYKAWKQKPEGIIESGLMYFRTRSLDYNSASVQP